MSFLQNMLGRIIDITNISQSIEDAVKDDYTFGIHYNAARLNRIMIHFDPIELVDDDSDFTNPSSGGDDSSENDPDELMV